MVSCEGKNLDFPTGGPSWLSLNNSRGGNSGIADCAFFLQVASWNTQMTLWSPCTTEISGGRCWAGVEGCTESWRHSGSNCIQLLKTDSLRMTSPIRQYTQQTGTLEHRCGRIAVQVSPIMCTKTTFWKELFLFPKVIRGFNQWLRYNATREWGAYIVIGNEPPLGEPELGQGYITFVLKHFGGWATAVPSIQPLVCVHRSD